MKIRSFRAVAVGLITAALVATGLAFAGPASADPGVTLGGVSFTVTGTAVDTDAEATASNGYSVTLDGAVAASGTWHTGAVPDAVPTGTVQRVSGADRYATSVALAKTAFPSKAGVVFLATGENFPDALAAGPAAAHEGGPLLLTASGSLPPEVGSEIAALRPYRVVIVGGTAAVSPAVAAEVHTVVPDATVDRLAGADRYETDRLVIADAYPDGATARDLYITTGANYPDALSAGAAAGLDGALLLVPGSDSTIDAATKALITRLAPTYVVDPPTATIVGGPAAVSDAVQNALQQVGSYPRYSWSRVAGADRYVTSELLARAATTTGYAVRGVYVATGTDFPDALVASAVAGPVHEPLLLTPRTCMPDLTRDAIATIAPTTITLVGGPAVLADSVGAFARC